MTDFYGDTRVMTPRAAGWLSFAAALLVVSGVFKILDALWAFKYDDDVSEEVQTVLFEHDLASWGWLWLGVGIVLVLAGFAVVSGAQWARWVGIVTASIAAILFLPWIYYQPLWTILSVTLAILVVYALAAYGGPGEPRTPASA
ncbi:MAG TPA: hypothetical protein VFH02_00135 [Jiangellaceae bacterium]|nr:hypothetical protein [Jiangellaceae bacterium]